MGGSGGGYTLWGSAGQPDAALPRGGAGYELRSGFWHAACAAALVPVTIVRSGDTITLAWTHSGENVTYQVHRSSSPYLSPSDATRRAWVSGLPWSYSEVTAPNPGDNRYYVVRGACGAAYVDAGPKGTFAFALTPGAQ